MSTKLRIQGYTALFKLSLYEKEERLISLTGYSIEMNRNILDSEGHWGQYDVQGFNTLKRLKTVYLQDCPTYSLSVDFELTEPLLDDILSQITTAREKKITSLFLDSANGISITLGEMYLTSFSMSIDNNDIAKGKLDFLVRRSDFYYEFCENLNLEAKSTTLPFDIDNKLMPYYWWGLDTEVFDVPNIISFNLTWSQELIPKFTCNNSVEDLAPTFQYLYFCKPEVKFSSDVFLGSNTVINYDQYIGTNLNVEFKDDFLHLENIYVKYKGVNKLEMNGVVVKEFSPNFNLGGRYECSFNCDVYGVLKKISN